MIKQRDVIIRLLDALYPGVMIYLFGSRARGTNAPGTDIDLALDAKRKLSIEEISTAKTVLEGLYLPWAVDVVDMHSIPQYLKDVILKEGIIWKN